MPTDQQAMQEAVKSIISGLMDRVMDRVLNTDPFDFDRLKTDKPLYTALLPEEILKGSHFERRFVTPFGHVWEELAVVAAEHGLGKGESGVTVSGTVKSGRINRITEVLRGLEHPDENEGRKSPDWNQELAYVMGGEGEDTPVQVVCDVLAEDTEKGLKYAFELKAPLPNSDQTKVSKEKILKLYAMEPRQVSGAYFALPYNPYGRREDYAWDFPARWFNMREDETVLIGDEFWEKLGGRGTYQTFINAINEVGEQYKNRIYREFLGVEPPHEA